MIHHVNNDVLDDLVELWHEDAWPELELEDIIREATGWSHHNYDRWVATGRMPDEPLPNGLAERNWCGHEQGTR